MNMLYMANQQTSKLTASSSTSWGIHYLPLHCV